MNEFMKAKEQMHRLVGLQKVLKKRRHQLNLDIADIYQRFERNGGQYDGRSLVPMVPAWDLPRFVSKLGKVERQIVANRKKIQELSSRLVNMKIHRIMTRAAERAFRNFNWVPKPRDVVQSILGAQGMFLHDNNEISGQGGRLIAYYGDDARIINGELTYTIKPLKSLDFIMIDIEISDLKVSDNG